MVASAFPISLTTLPDDSRSVSLYELLFPVKVLNEFGLPDSMAPRGKEEEEWEELLQPKTEFTVTMLFHHLLKCLPGFRHRYRTQCSNERWNRMY